MLDEAHSKGHTPISTAALAHSRSQLRGLFPMFLPKSAGGLKIAQPCCSSKLGLPCGSHLSRRSFLTFLASRILSANRLNRLPCSRFAKAPGPGLSETHVSPTSHSPDFLTSCVSAAQDSEVLSSCCFAYLFVNQDEQKACEHSANNRDKPLAAE